MAKALSKATSMSGDEKPTPKVDNKLREDWNMFLDYLDKKGIRGNPTLDAGGLGYKLYDQYVKETPNTTLSRATLPIIRGEMTKYRQWVLDEAKAGRARLPEGLKEEDFMKHILANESTADPLYPGSQLTATKFPSGFLKTFLNDKLVKEEKIPFVTVSK